MYAWDEVKSELKKRKHGVSFETTQSVFDDSMHLSRQDRVVDDEERLQTIDIVGEVTLILVAHTWTVGDVEEHIRIISARRANKTERSIYERNTWGDT